MTPAALRRLAFFVAALLLLAFLGQGLVERLFINPLVSGIWIFQPVIAVIHMLIWWGVLLPAAVTLAIYSLRRKSSVDEQEESHGKITSRIENWAAWLNNLDESEYFRSHLARQLGDLTIQILGQKERLEPEEAIEKFRRGGFDLPGDIRGYLEWGYNYRARPAPMNLQQRLAELVAGREETFKIERLVGFLEEQLEIDQPPEKS